jgi:hypothetical protein
MPVLSALWKAFNLIAQIRLELAELRNQLVITNNQISHLDERWEALTAQTLQRFEHFANRSKAETHLLQLHTREMQNYLAKTTNFEIRSPE